MRPDWAQLAAADLERLRSQHLFRQRRTIRTIDATHVDVDGRVLVNFASNNYLGLTHHPKILAAVTNSLAVHGLGSGAAPLISGYSEAHRSAERAIAKWKGTESATIFPSGYQANFAAIQTIAAIGRLSGGVRFLVDKLAHASLIDAIRSSGEEFHVFPHQGLEKLTRLLDQAPASQLQAVVTESIFSMDGDSADLVALARLKEKYGFLLLCDEAHATGVYGRAGAGLAAELDLRSAVDASVFTLSKAMGGIGGVVCGSSVFGDALINYGRPYLFSTAVPPAIASAAEAAINVLATEPQRQSRLRELSIQVRREIGKGKFELPASDSPIIPLILGTEDDALQAADEMMRRGLFVVAIRPPTVPRGSSRLRITLSSEHTDDEIEQLVDALDACPHHRAMSQNEPIR